MSLALKECYAILQLKEGADEDQIKRAYRRLALKCHPDKNPQDKEAENKFRVINEAYSKLIDKRHIGISFGFADEVQDFFNQAMRDIKESFGRMTEDLDASFAQIEDHLVHMRFAMGGGILESIISLFQLIKSKKHEKITSDESYDIFYRENYDKGKGILNLWLTDLNPFQKEELLELIRTCLKRGLMREKTGDEHQEDKINLFGYPFVFFGGWHYIILRQRKGCTYLYVNIPSQELGTFYEKLKKKFNLSKINLITRD